MAIGTIVVVGTYLIYYDFQTHAISDAIAGSFERFPSNIVSIWDSIFVTPTMTVAVTSATILAMEDPDPYGRPGQKKQGRERKNKSRKKDDWEDKSGKRRQDPPKKHSPSKKGHRKFKIVPYFPFRDLYVD